MEENQILELAIKKFAKLPGFGKRAAKKAILYFIKNPSEIEEISTILQKVKNSTALCEECFSLTEKENGILCKICSNKDFRDKSTLCVVEDLENVFQIEETKMYNGLYHVLCGKICVTQGVMPENLKITELLKRLENNEISEIIFANNLSPQSKTTVFYIYDRIKELQDINKIKNDIKITELAHGIPIGSSLEFMDDGTIFAAFKSRTSMI